MRPELTAGPVSWLQALFPGYVAAPMATYHDEFWRWVWAITPASSPPPFIAIWPRGAGKSTAAELAVALLGAKGARRYALYVCETQTQADDHVANVGGLLEATRFTDAYPDVGARKVGKYGSSAGWRRNRLRTASGFTIDAIGLDTAARGVKLDEDRPDLIILDDLDHELDTPAATAKKITSLTRKLIPAGSTTTPPAILAVQNLILKDGIFARLADGRADFLAGRKVSGPYPAIRDITYEQRDDGTFTITGGTYTWPEGMGPAVCQADMDRMGLTAWLAEKNHIVDDPAGGMFDHLTYRHVAFADLPDLVRVVVWCDPAVTDTDQSDANGIQADGLGPDGTIYRLFSWERRASARTTLRTAITKAVELGADTVGVETDQGGDLWKSEYAHVAAELVAEGAVAERDVPRYREAKAGAGHGPKTARAGKMLSAYERGELVHVTGTHTTLERALRRFPLTKPLDLADAAYWSWHDLTARTPTTAVPTSIIKRSTWK